jgi:hypothetical protein
MSAARTDCMPQLASTPRGLVVLLMLALLASLFAAAATAAPASTLSAWGVTFEAPVSIGPGGGHDGCQGFDAKHMVSGSRCSSDGAKTWFSCNDTYGFVPAGGAILRVNASGPTGPSTELRNMGSQWGDYLDMAGLKCTAAATGHSPSSLDAPSTAAETPKCDPKTQYICTNYTDFYAEGPPRFNESVHATRLTSDGKLVEVELPKGANTMMKFDGMKEKGVAFTCGSDCKRGMFGCPFRLGGRGIARRADGGYVQTVITYLLPGTAASPGLGEGNQNGPLATSVVAFESDDGWHWKFLSVVLTPSDPISSDSEEGPNECGSRVRTHARLPHTRRAAVADKFIHFRFFLFARII